MKPMTQQLLRYAAARAAEPSTWRGLVSLLASAGLALAPETQDLLVATALNIVQAAFGLTGLIALLTPDVKHPPEN